MLFRIPLVLIGLFTLTSTVSGQFRSDTMPNSSNNSAFYFLSSNAKTMIRDYFSDDSTKMIIRWYNDGDILLRKTPYSSTNKPTIHGTDSQWYVSGMVRYAKSYNLGKEEGSHTFYYKGGQLKEKKTYQNGKLKGELKTFYTHGQLKRLDKYQNGVLVDSSCFGVAGTDTTYFPLDIHARFPGGTDKMQRFIMYNLKYPRRAQYNDIEGKIMIQFVVEKDGRLSNVKSLYPPSRKLGWGCEEAGIEVVKKMPRWSPGYHDGIPVRQLFNLPLFFQLE